MLKVLIIDDEKPARDFIRYLLGKTDGFEIIGEAKNGFEGLKLIKDLSPDLIFLDIQMPKINGFELLELIDDAPLVIFVTAHNEHAIRAFDLNAVDYLLKPINEERFNQALGKALDKPKANNNLQDLAESRIAEEEKLSQIVVKTGHKIDIVHVDEIIRIQSDDDYVEIFTRENKFLKKQRLQFLEDHLPDDSFCRVHRSHIIKIKMLNKIESMGKESYIAALKNGEKIPVSNSGYKKLKEILKF